MKLEPYSTVRASQPQRIGNAKLRALASLSGDVSDKLFSVAANKRAKAGKQAGLEAGQAAAERGEMPQIQQSLFPTIFDDAFNAAQQSAYIASVDAKATEHITRIADENALDAEAFTKLSDGALKGYLQDSPSAYKPFLKQSISNQIERHKTRINKNIFDKGQKDAQTELLNSIDTYSREAMRSARNGDFDSVDDMLAKAELVGQAMISSGFWNKTQAEEHAVGVRKQIYHQENKRDILAVAEQDFDSAVKKLQKLEKVIPANHSPLEHERNMDDIRTDLRRLMPNKEGGAASKSIINRALRDMKNRINAGFVPSTEELTQLEAMTAGTDKHTDFVRLKNVREYSLLSNDQKKNVRQMLADSDNPEHQLDFIALQSFDDKFTTMAEEDGIGLARRQGLTVPPIDEGDMTARHEFAAQYSDKIGVEIGPFELSEIEDIIRSMEGKSPIEKAEMTMAFDDNERTYQQFDKKGASLFAMLSARGDKELASHVFMGEELIKTGQAKKPTATEYQAVVDEFLGEVGEVYGVEDRATTVKAALFHYVATNNDTIFDSSALERSLAAVTGGIGDINGRKVELPQNVSEDELEDFWATVKPEILDMFGGLKHPYDIGDVRDFNLVSRGGGRYHVQINNNGNNLPNKDNAPFEIEVTPELIKLNRSKQVKANFDNVSFGGL